jgi:uncharacterized membrane protein YcaP (DUF421 family)
MRELLLGTESWDFLGAVAIRTLVMFTVILCGLRMLGKRGVKQLSVFELGVIVGLGSAAGDPMFYSDVGLLPAFVVFGVVLALYRTLEAIMNRSEHAAERLEGRPIEILRDGALVPNAVRSIEITTPEVFMQLRVRTVSHLGQIERAIVEPNGEVSVFFYPDDAVKPGLPIIPALYDESIDTITDDKATYSCKHCGHTTTLAPGDPQRCSRCDRNAWVRALSAPRVR